MRVRMISVANSRTEVAKIGFRRYWRQAKSESHESVAPGIDFNPQRRVHHYNTLRVRDDSTTQEGFDHGDTEVTEKRRGRRLWANARNHRRLYPRKQKWSSLCSLCLRGESLLQGSSADRVAAIFPGGFGHGYNILGGHVGLNGVDRAQNKTATGRKVVDASTDLRCHLIH